MFSLFMCLIFVRKVMFFVHLLTNQPVDLASGYSKHVTCSLFQTCICRLRKCEQNPWRLTWKCWSVNMITRLKTWLVLLKGSDWRCLNGVEESEEAQLIDDKLLDLKRSLVGYASTWFMDLCCELWLHGRFVAVSYLYLIYRRIKRVLVWRYWALYSWLRGQLILLSWSDCFF